MIGLAATTLTTASFLPQVIRARRSRSTNDISTGMFTLMARGNSLWLIYGALITDVPLVAANAIMLALVAAILALKLRNG